MTQNKWQMINQNGDWDGAGQTYDIGRAGEIARWVHQNRWWWTLGTRLNALLLNASERPSDRK